MSHGINGFDHIVVAVRDLEDARDAWLRLGFTCTPRGRHRNMATGNYCIMFPNDYVELIGVVDPGADDRGLISRMEDNGEGLDRLAFSVFDADRTVESLNADGVGIRGPLDLRRPLELPEGEVEPRFRLVHFEDPATTTPGIHGFICYHETPEITRGEPAWLQHENGVQSILTITAVVENPESLVDGWQRLLGPGATVLTDDTLTVHTGSHALIFVTPDHLDVMFPGVADETQRKAPFMAAATFRVGDTEATARLLSDRGVSFRQDRDGGILVSPGEANGVIVAFE
ncbi:VOC family protein [Minwuia sp.]|uniref:VOC family protein n=1 Tax=Minwuia sp. TaxID=2493630 RepID=UPI003A9572D2